MATAAHGLDKGLKTRFDWIDFARGLSIILVALMHVSLSIKNMSHNENLFWWRISDFLATIRMPLFFLISGYLSASVLKRGFSENSQRIFGIYLLYAFWTAIFLSRLLIPFARGDKPLPDATGFLLSLLLPTSFWYIWALPAFHLIAWLGWRCFGKRSSFIIVVMAALSFFSVEIDEATRSVLTDPLDSLKLGAMARNGVWFFVGIHYKDRWNQLIAEASLFKILISGTILFVLTLSIITINKKYIYILGTPISVIALYFMANVLGKMDYSSSPARFASWVGKKTLPVYIFHIFGISVVSGLIKFTGLQPLVINHSVLFDFFASAVICLALVTSARLAGDLLEFIGLKGLIYPMKFTPSRKENLIENAAAPGTAKDERKRAEPTPTLTSSPALLESES